MQYTRIEISKSKILTTSITRTDYAIYFGGFSRFKCFS